jgi:alcohol dehydrogenase YqhD (iron-dependent ADH family)
MRLQPFTFCAPKVVFGEGAIAKTGEETARIGKKALVVSFREAHVKSLGFWDKVNSSCAAAGVEVIPYFDVKPNPTMEHCAGAIEICKKEHVDVIVGLGGGSVMDSAKYIAMGALYDGDPWDFFCGKKKPGRALPTVMVVTNPATSSETNGTTVMNSLAHARKEGFASPILKPQCAILDPELTYGIPIRSTAYCCADIVSHLMESYIGSELDFTPYQDHFCEGGIRSIMEIMDRLLKDPRDPEARSILMWQASFAWSGFYDSGYGLHNSNIHILGHSLSNFYDTPHGAAMSVTILATLRYYLPKRAARYAQFAREVFGIRERDDVIAAQAGIAAMEAWFHKIGTPTTLREAGITDPGACEKMAADAYQTAIAWGEAEHWGYTPDVCRAQFELCR